MAIPDYQTIMLPLLKLTTDSEEHSNGEITEKLANYFNLNEAEKDELLPSGRQAKFNNRVHWAKTYLTKACLLEATGRGKFKLSQRGKNTLAENPPSINKHYLMRFTEFVEFQRRTHQPEGIEGEIKESSQTPLEILEESYQNLRESLAQEVLDMVKRCRPNFFEQLVVDLLLAMGYGGSRKDAGSAIGRSGDEGVDGIIKEDKLGLDIVYIQAKRYNSTVGIEEVHAFAGSLEGFRARKGVMITTSKFSTKAYEYVNKIEKKIILIDGEQLAQLMIDHEIGVTPIITYEVKRIDQDYFEEN